MYELIFSSHQLVQDWKKQYLKGKLEDRTDYFDAHSSFAARTLCQRKTSKHSASLYIVPLHCVHNRFKRCKTIYFVLNIVAKLTDACQLLATIFLYKQTPEALQSET